MDQLKDLLKCVICKKTLSASPIILSCCNKTVCEHHVQFKKKKTGSFNCALCKTPHQIENVKLFARNEIVEKILQIKIFESIELNKKADLGDVFAKTSKEIENLELSLEKISDFIKDPKNFIYETISSLKRNVDLRREKLKEKIDEISHEMIQKLDNFQNECYENIVNTKLEEKTSDMLKEIKTSLDEWNKQNKHILIVSNDSKRKEIQSKAIEIDTKIFAALIDLKKELLMNKNWVYLENEKVTQEFKKELIQFEG